METSRESGDSEFVVQLQRLGEGVPDRAQLRELSDALLRVVGAERLFLLLFRKGGGFRVVTARDYDGEDISEPLQRISHYAVGKMEQERGPWIVPDARKDRRYRSEDVLVGRKVPRTILIFPLFLGAELIGGVYVDHRFRSLDPEIGESSEVRAWMGLCAVALHLRELRKRSRLAEKKLESEKRAVPISSHPGVLGPNRHSPEELPEPEEFHGFLSANPDLRDLFDSLRQISDADIPVLITGETGVGKSLLARAVHLSSSRREGPFIALACGAIPDSLMESELLGHSKGAFTSAESDRVGVFAQAHRGTLLLDEIADMSLEMQSKLLRILEDGMVRPLGCSHSEIVEVDVRIVSCTSQSIVSLVRDGRFRPDLLFRLKSFVVELSPLRERTEDIPCLAAYFARVYNRQGRDARIENQAMDKLVDQPWSGNVRELENEMRRVMATEIDPITANSVCPGGPGRARRAAGPGDGTSLDEIVSIAERDAIADALRRSAGNKSQAAASLSITRKALYRRLNKYGFDFGSENVDPAEDT